MGKSESYKEITDEEVYTIHKLHGCS